MDNFAVYFHLIAAVCFILSIRGLASPSSARRGNLIGMVGMAIVVFTTIAMPSTHNVVWIFVAILSGGLVGSLIALRIQMTALPQLMALFHSFVGLAAVFIASAAYTSPEEYGIDLLNVGQIVELSVGLVIGSITFTGSCVAFMKLQGVFPNWKFLMFKNQRVVSGVFLLTIVALVVAFAYEAQLELFVLLLVVGLLFGFLSVSPIGGADMPVIVSVLNSYSGWAAVGIGFSLSNPVLIITGSLVGASGAILSYIMSKNMNRSIISILMGGFGTEDATAVVQTEGESIKQAHAEDVAYFMQNAESVVIVPGYGMAVGHAQHALKEVVDCLKERGVLVRFAIHPVAGRMPGHMNVLLAEADVDYDDILELEEINSDFSTTDIVLVIGANDVFNPAAKTDKSSPIYGMPILDVQNAKQIFIIKRSMAPGYAGIPNAAFYLDKSFMVFGDAKKVCENIFKALD